MVGGWGERLVEHCPFQNRNPVRVFLYHSISDGNQLFSENFGCHFHFILHIMSDKAAFVSRALFCVQRYRQGCQVFSAKPAQLILKTSPEVAQLLFRGDPLVKIVFREVKYTFFGRVPLVKVAFQGLNITLLGLPQPADMKNIPWKEC